MMFKNSIKLFIANFSIFWKVLLYKLIAFGICILLMIPFIAEWSACLSSVGFFDIFTNIITNIDLTGGSHLLTNLFALVQSFILAAGEIISTNLFAFIYTTVIIIFIMPFLLNLSSVPAGECIYSYMSCLNKTGFSASFISKFKKSSKYSFYRTLLCVPFMIIFILGLYGFISLVSLGGLIQVFLPLIILLYTVLFLSFGETLISGWMPALLVFNCTQLKSFKKGVKAVSRRFWRVFSSVLFTFIIASILTALFTMTSIIVLISLFYTWFIMFEMVMFFESQGMRYYVDLDTIISPKKLETKDSMKKVKDII